MILVEDNLNFYEELKKQLNDNNANCNTNDTPAEVDIANSIKHDEYIGKCLITNEKLKEGYVTLLCNHSFNYIPLYNDLLNHKKTLHLDTQMLKMNEIRCPYCRNKQSVLLPYYECMGVPKITGINYIKKAGTFVGNCHFDELKNIIQTKEWYNDKLQLFDDSNDNIICSNIVTILKENEKCYCSFHKANAKLLFYKNKKFEKKLWLQKQKEEQKQSNLETQSENIIIDMNFCNIILVSGKNKGSQCSQKIYCNEKCKRHYNMQVKKNLLQIIEEDNVEVDEAIGENIIDENKGKNPKNLCKIA